ncbi:holo-ACP synthase [Aquibacillus salsiterrae]|uniref:Holo-[acyl-carrier-protein] synthase n=1 Tax=Aquibacillus salsiterrae TaxID=2950439 RepID=A0A9X3WE36_9BACI|nr:holo-ACP synthase [Aquibacillus salsiterrae]MDC3417033.1 holo-ACP synthase [Aquibacillus salsiterrae]
MIKGIGIDIVQITRIAEAVNKNPRFAKRILTTNELDIWNQLTSNKRKMEFVAGRFAAKEAYSKAIGTGIGKVGFLDIEILPNKQGAPTLVANQIDGERVFVSISHSEAYVVAQVVVESV